MKSNGQFKYLQLPLCCLQNILDDPHERINDIISFGVARYANKIEVTSKSIAQQALYDVLRNPSLVDSHLHNSLIEEYEQRGTIYLDDATLFDSDGNVDDLQITALENYLLKNPELYEIAKYHYQLYRSFKYFNLVRFDCSARVKTVEKLKEQHELKHGAQPMPMVAKDLAMDFLNNHDDIHLLMAHIAISSLQGNKQFVGTNKKIILQRMVGCKSNAALADLSNTNAKAFYSRFNKRWHFDKLMIDLQLRGLIRGKISAYKRFYLSTSITSNQLAEELARNLNERNLKAKEQEAKNKLKQLLIK